MHASHTSSYCTHAPSAPKNANTRLEALLKTPAKEDGYKAKGKRLRDRSPSPLRDRPTTTATPRRKGDNLTKAKQQSTPTRDHKKRRTSDDQDDLKGFRQGAAISPLSACTLCLGRQPHDIANCSATALWDGSELYCTWNEDRRLVDPKRNVLCSDWQRRNGCTSTQHNRRHLCSGCGANNHGAQNCPRAEKP